MKAIRNHPSLFYEYLNERAILPYPSYPFLPFR